MKKDAVNVLVKTTMHDVSIMELTLEIALEDVTTIVVINNVAV